MTGADPNLGQESKAAMALAIEPLIGSPADRVAELVAESERHGLRFIRRLTEEWAQFYEAIGFRSSGATDNSNHVMVLGG